jgi:CHASE2 domain-containing sensor protein
MEAMTERLRFRRFFLESLNRNQRLGFAAFFLVILGLPLVFPGLTDSVDRLFLDTAQALMRPFRAPSPEIVVVSIDQPSVTALGRPWPWPRALQADLFERIGSAAPRLIICDILYQQPEAESSGQGDLRLEQVFRRLGNVGLISLLEPSEGTRGLSIQTFFSHKALRRAAHYEGFVWAWIDDDEQIRSFVVRDARIGEESITAKTARRCREAIEFPSPGADRLSRSLIAFPREGGIPVLSAATVLQSPRALGELRGKIVLVGVGAERQRDYHHTAFGELPGTMLLAYSLDTLLTGRQVSRNAVWWVPFLLGVLGFTAGFLLLTRASQGRIPWSGIAAVAPPLLGFVVAPWVRLLVLPGAYLYGWVIAGILVGGFRLFSTILETRHIQREAEVVGELQKRFFPAAPFRSSNGIECAGFCLPCEEAGGDYYDHIECPDGSVFFLIADVTGHGFGAGLITSMAKATVTRLLQEGTTDLNLMAESLNLTLLASLQKKKLMTAILGTLFPEKNQVNLRFCGHLPAYHLRSDGTLIDVSCPSFPLGAIHRKALPSLREVHLEPGDTLVLYTDGIVEATDWQDQPLTFVGWQALLKQCLPIVSAAEFYEKALARLRAFTGDRPFTDDVTLLVITHRPREA